MNVEEMGKLKVLVFNEEAIKRELRSPGVKQSIITKMLRE